jgi:broad specificity phosphatase PhoE/ribonuclease HI
VGGRRLVVEADGGSRGNPGRAGYGALVRDAASGTVIAERAESVGIASNNVAEYSGLVAGLKAAFDIDPAAEVTVRLDSKLLVEQMSGRWKIKQQDMRRLALQAQEIAADLSAAGGSVTYTWVPRAENSAADALANSAMDGTPVNWTSASELSVQAPSTDAVGSLADLGAPTRIVLVRHGVTDLTSAGRLDGRGGPDPSLNAEGRRQARAAAAGVRAFIGDSSAQVITSSLKRAIETSMGFLRAHHPQELARFREDPYYSRPGGEAHADLEARVLAGFERARAVGGTVVVASHRKPIMIVLAHVLGIRYERIWRLATAPASLTCVEVWAAGAASVAFVNDTSHLR